MNFIQALGNSREQLKRDFQVNRIGVFGSYARNEETASSDVDILVEFSAPVDMFKFIGLQQYLETLLGRKVDLVTPKALKPQLKDRILREVVYV